MEERGRVRRGYFVEGLGGAQFCIPAALDRLRAERGDPGGDRAPSERADPGRRRPGQPVRRVAGVAALVGGRPPAAGPRRRSLRRARSMASRCCTWSAAASRSRRCPRSPIPSWPRRRSTACASWSPTAVSGHSRSSASTASRSASRSMPRRSPAPASSGLIGAGCSRECLRATRSRGSPTSCGRVLVGQERHGGAGPARWSAAGASGRRRPSHDVEARGKHLLIAFSNGLTLHTHLGLHGEWHRYRPGERWHMPTSQAVAVLETPIQVAVCFDAPTVELIETRALAHSPRPGAAWAATSPATRSTPARRCGRCAIRHARPRRSATRLLDQRAVAGLGNVYRSELCFLERVNPFTPVSEVSDETPDAHARPRRRADPSKLARRRPHHHLTRHARQYLRLRPRGPPVPPLRHADQHCSVELKAAVERHAAARLLVLAAASLNPSRPRAKARRPTREPGSPAGTGGGRSARCPSAHGLRPGRERQDAEHTEDRHARQPRCAAVERQEHHRHDLQRAAERPQQPAQPAARPPADPSGQRDEDVDVAGVQVGGDRRAPGRRRMTAVPSGRRSYAQPPTRRRATGSQRASRTTPCPTAAAPRAGTGTATTARTRTAARPRTAPRTAREAPGRCPGRPATDGRPSSKPAHRTRQAILAPTGAPGRCRRPARAGGSPRFAADRSGADQPCSDAQGLLARVVMGGAFVRPPRSERVGRPPPGAHPSGSTSRDL